MKTFATIVVLCWGCSSAALDRTPPKPPPVAQAPHAEMARSGAPVETPPPAESALIPAEPSSVVPWEDEPEESVAPTPQRLREDSGACLAPLDSANPSDPYETFIGQVLGLPDPTIVASMLVSPSFEHPWLLSIHRAAHGQFRLRVTRLDQDVWSVMMQRMHGLQGDVVHLDADQQARALASISVHPSVFGRAIDRETANLLVALWQTLIARAQVIQTDFAMFDGVQYELSVPGHTGSVVSPHGETILGDATATAERLGAIVESPSVNDGQTLREIRDKLRKTLDRARKKEACVRMVTQ